MSLQTIRQDWFSNVRDDLPAGLYASFSIATLIAFFGGRPGMISAAAGAMALVILILVKASGPWANGASASRWQRWWR